MKITKLVGILVLVGSLSLAGCARIALYDNPKLEGPEVGVKYYYSKPYLLVGPTGNKETPLQASVIYLPDQSKPVYAKLKTGYGSAELSLAFQNSILTTIGQKTDTKIPETMNALANMATAASSFLKLQAAPYREISDRLARIANELSDQYKTAKNNKLLNPNELQILSIIVDNIRQASALLADPTKATSNIAAAINLLNTAIRNWDQIRPGNSGVHQIIQKDRLEVQNILTQLSQSLQNPATELPTFMLYEIDNSSGSTILKRVIE